MNEKLEKYAFIYYPLFLALVVMLCVGLVTVVYEMTEKVVQENYQESINDSLEVMYPNSKYEVMSDTTFESENEYVEFLSLVKVTDPNENIHYVYEVKVMGRNDYIDFFVGFDEQGIISGYSVVEHMETPGIGDIIVSPDYTTAILGQSAEEVEVDTVSGATYSTEAVKKGVEAAANEYLLSVGGDQK